MGALRPLDAQAPHPSGPQGSPTATDLTVLEEIWEVQRTYNQHFVDLPSLTQSGREQLTKDYALYAVEELMEMVRHLHWKVHRKEHVVPSKANILEEVVDVFKYMVGVGLAWGATPAEFLEAFRRKSEVVEQRWKQEFEHPYDPARHRGQVVVDIDGVLADYVGGYLDWVRVRTGATIPLPRPGQDTSDAVAAVFGAEQAALLKHEYRESGGKLSLAPLPKARVLMETLRDYGLYVVILSSRPYRLYRRIMADTLAWLRAHQIPYDAIIWDPAKYARITKDYSNLVALFEDEASHAIPIAEKGTPVFMPDQPYNRSVSHERIFRYEPSQFEVVVFPRLGACLRAEAGERLPEAEV